MSKEKILRLLIDKKQPITSKTFAKYLNVSSRTVINYIKDINESKTSPVITSDYQGYSASVDEVVSILKEMQKSRGLPQNFNERSTHIVRRLLFKNEMINIYDFSSDLFISVSTLKNDVYKTNKIYKKFNCKIEYNNEYIYIKGAEKDKRSMLAFIIRRETVGSLMDINILKRLFNNGYVTAIKAALDQTLKENALYINDYAYMNIMLHLSIIIDNTSTPKRKDLSLDFSSINNVAKILYDSLINDLDIRINQSQLNNINSMLNTRLITYNNKNKKALENNIDRKHLLNARKISQKVNEIFSINICRDDFILPLAQHLEGLIKRLKQNQHEVNPMTSIIKKDNPFIYEIAVNIMAFIIKTYKLEKKVLTEDEIAFIALHVGSTITKNNQNANKLKAIILCPEYRDTRKNLVENIQANFNSLINIEDVISYPHEINNKDYDILIKTIPDDIFMPDNSVLIDLIDFDKNKIMIQEKITNINKIENTSLLLENFEDFFRKDNFYKTDRIFKDKFEIINFLGQSMIDSNIITSNHLDDIVKREKMSSTSFDNIAIPHALSMNARETSISVLVSSEGIKWDKNIVNIIFLIAVSDTDKSYFKVIYQGLLTIFEDENIPFIAKQLKDYQSLKSFFKETNKFIT